MALFQSNNPVLKEDVFNKAPYATGDAMTIRGTVNKMSFLLIMLMAASVFSWGQYYRGSAVLPLVIGGAIGGFILALVIIFKKEWSPYLAPAYAIAEGLFLGAISAMYESQWHGIVLQAVGLTFGTFIAMLVLYRTGVIRATERFKSIIITATAGIAFFYLIAIVLRLFNIDMPFIHSSGTFGIIFSLVVVGVAALNLILDFDMIEQGAAHGAPKYYEWYASFGLMVTLVWLYLEILRLLSKLNRR
ncbi:Bax inhibitor-1/YccA family protein [Chitinophaga nivalis]|uniref:Bax inhibitor-1/YccA family protein n=1 Tax=Chitinophaga nivalis TaxID=2991709 RepID=A0ABT3IWG3_9BACT|nr:Bax inhibitor-1/YccA family protein [Chitinophaga nivalis]MCW3461982.1 Bax inhibitor-1/YccA family protein [Chitinophaga nivalis]MCW3488327.1 Bax inhibitor-1/YccA family protein [Chitinophaga nivalis]